MRFVSKATLAAAVAVSSVTVGLGIAPAAAQEQQEEAAPLQVSEEFRTVAVAAEAAVKAQDWPTAAARLAEASALVKTEDERYFMAALGVPVAANNNDDKTLATYLDILIASPKTPQTDVPRYTFLRGNLAFNAKNYPEAITYLTKAQQFGFTNENLPLMIASANFNTNNAAAGLAALETAIKAKEAAGQKAPENWYALAVQKVYGTNDRAATAAWLQRLVRAYPTPTNWHKVIAVYRDGPGAVQLDKGQQLDLFRLQRAANAMANLSDYLIYAELANGMGIPYETRTLIEQGRANGKVPSSNGTANQLLSAATSAIKSEGSLDASEKRARSASDGTTAAATANAYLASGDYAKAIELYQLAQQKGGGNPEEVNTRLGIAYALSNQKDLAAQSFAKVTARPRVDIADFWELWLEIGSQGAAPATAQPAAAPATTPAPAQ